MAQRLFCLTVDDLTAHGRFNLRLTDGRGKFLAPNEVRADPKDARWRGLLELDRYLEIESGRGRTVEQLLAELGDFLRSAVLGSEIAGHLFGSQSPGTLFVELPRERRPEVLELTRIPWEITRDERGRTLPDVGLAVQVLPRGAMPEDVSLDRALADARPFEPSGPLRVLLAFAQSRGQTALAMRHMRERLRTFFLRDLAPRYQIDLDILQYGVTPRAIERAALRGGGYHIVHLFAHGHEDLLVLEDDQGRDKLVSGEYVAGLLSGSFAAPPYLVFLTACHSGELRQQHELAQVWQTLRQMRQAAATPAAEAALDTLEDSLNPDYTGTAMAMLRAEVPQVVAMRYAVEESFAFDLAEQFYRYVLLDQMPPALALGRFRADARREGVERGYRPHDWLTPAFFGGPAGSQPIILQPGRSAAADRLAIRGRLPNELRRVKLFVGRGDELRALRQRVFDEQADRAVALLWGVGGLGKTALAAEAIHIWHADFDVVFGARPPTTGGTLSLDSWLYDVGYHAMTSLGEAGYRIWDEQGDLPRDLWLRSRLDELVRFLNSHRILLVLDNFESNLRRQGEAGDVRYVCADPNWATTLARLARDLTPGLSCLLITSRPAPAELADPDHVLNLPVGPLDPGEWAVFARTAPNFRALLRSEDAEHRRLLARALAVARGHPLILTALEHLAADPPELARRLDAFEERGRRYAGIGDLLATARSPTERAQEMAYFEDIAAHSVRALVADRSPAARRLLRVVTLALEMVHDGLIAYVWEDEGFPDSMPRLQPDGQGWREPLKELLGAGLLTEEVKTATSGAGEQEEVVTYVWHPIVAEQAAEVLPSQPGEGADPLPGLFPEGDYVRRYATYNLGAFVQYRKQAQSRAQAELALRAARDAVPYLLQLRDTTTAVRLINDIHNLSGALDLRRELQSWIGELLAQVESGEDRESLLVALADIYRSEGRPGEAIPLYEQALASTEAREDWYSCGVISQNLGIALRDAADYPAARAAYRQSLRYKRRSGKTISGRMSSLGELVRLLIIEGGEGNLARASAHAGRLVAIARAYYERCQEDPSAREERATNEPVDLLIGTLDVLDDVSQAGNDWETCAQIRGQQLALVQCHNKGEVTIASVVFNRAAALKNLGLLDDAERDLVVCLRVDREHQQPLGESKDLGQLASIAHRRGDAERAAQFEAQSLALCHRLGALSDAAKSHHSLDIYLWKLGRREQAVLELCCAGLITMLIGERGLLQTTLDNLRIDLSELSPGDRLAWWPTAATIFATYPRLGELLDARGMGEPQAQQVLDRLWELVATEEE